MRRAFQVAMHVARLAADEGLVHFDVAFQQPFKRTGVQRHANAVPHEPGGFLGDAEGAVYFVATDAVLGVDSHPDRRQPLVEPQGRFLEDGADADTELPTRMILSALPTLLVRQPSNP